MGINPVTEPFLTTFRESCGVAGVDVGRRDAAVTALDELTTRAFAVMHQADIITPYYASHGPKHVARLAGVLNSILKKFQELDIQSEQMRQIVNADFLLLLHSALLLHDIGMSLILKEDQPRLEKGFHELWANRWVRKEHDKRSLRFIEEELISKATESSAWDAFWEEWADFTSPGGKFAFFIVARICQSHADDIHQWVMSDALRRYKLTYTSRVKNGPNEVDFVDDWPLRRTQGVLPWVEAGSALLCLCDLCEIGPHRFPTFDEALLKQLAPETNSERFYAFMHWFGHQCAWVDFQEVSGTAGGTHLIQPVCWIKEWPDQDHLRTLLFTHVGPVADLLLWGSHPQLLNCYERCHLPITTPALRIAAVDEGLAGRLELEASKEVFSSNWHFHNFNRAVLEGDAPDRYIPYAYRAITTGSSA